MHLESYLEIKEGITGNIMLVFNLPNPSDKCVSPFFDQVQAYNENCRLQSWCGLCYSMLTHSVPVSYLAH